MDVDRRGFLMTAGAGVGAAGLGLGTASSAEASPLTEKEKLARIASNTWPIRYIFKSRTGFGRNPKNEAAKQKYPNGWKTLKPYLRVVAQPTD